MRRAGIELFGVLTLRAGDSIELGQARVVSEQCLQACRLRSGQLHLSIQDVELRSSAGIQPRLGQSHGFSGWSPHFSVA